MKKNRAFVNFFLVDEGKSRPHLSLAGRRQTTDYIFEYQIITWNFSSKILALVVSSKTLLPFNHPNNRQKS